MVTGPHAQKSEGHQTESENRAPASDRLSPCGSPGTLAHQPDHVKPSQ